jgi:hypothetical protein
MKYGNVGDENECFMTVNREALRRRELWLGEALRQ